MEVVKNIFNLFIKCIYILTIIYLIIFIPKIFKYNPLVVISGSMNPTYQIGGLVYYHYENYENINPGDIVVYKYDNHIISHRVYRKLTNGLIVKGDANNNPDSLLITSNMILGVGTSLCIPYIGYYAGFIYNHKYLLVILIGTVIIKMFLNNYE